MCKHGDDVEWHSDRQTLASTQQQHTICSGFFSPGKIDFIFGSGTLFLQPSRSQNNDVAAPNIYLYCITFVTYAAPSLFLPVLVVGISADLIALINTQTDTHTLLRAQTSAITFGNTLIL